MELQNTMLLMSENDGAMVVKHPPIHPCDKKYRASFGACFSHYKTLTKEQQVIHLLASALLTMERFPTLKAKDLIDELEKVDEIKNIVSKCIPSF